MACCLVKSLNATSQASHATGEELRQTKEAILEHRATTDYLLLRSNHRYKGFKGLYCFNLIDNS